jgi:hypothetical protein
MSSNVLSLVQPQPQLVQNFAAVHHCGFWGGHLTFVSSPRGVPSLGDQTTPAQIPPVMASNQADVRAGMILGLSRAIGR